MKQEMLDALIGREGRYANNPADKGGETMWGITATVARAFGYTGPMSAMPRGIAERIYDERYWVQPGFDKVAAYSQPIAEELLDTGVNMGPAVAGMFLQRALNVLNRDGAAFPDVAVDGAVGRLTLAALGAYLAARGREGETVLLRLLNAQQAVRYMEIAEHNHAQEEFTYGWIRARVA